MSLRRTLRPALAAFTLLLAAPFATAADAPKPKWDPVRTTPPDDVAELRALQDVVKSVVDKVTPSTVAVLMGMGAGSGVIVSEDGLVLTAAHVIATPEIPGLPRPRGDGKKVQFVLSDGSVVNGVVLGRNPKVDSGMARITDKVPEKADWPGAKEGKWPAVKVGDSDAAKKGQWVVSLGHPGGPKLERRTPVRVGQVVKALQKERILVSDCTLVGGDSGGPLFDLTGRVIGIHSRIGPYIEDNIHIPTKAFQEEWDDLAAGLTISGKAEPYFGVALNRKGKSEPRVDGVVENSPAAKAGVEVGDVIRKFGGTAMDTSEDVDAAVNDTKPGTTVKLVVRRGDDTVQLDLTIGKIYNKNPRKSK